MLMPTFPKNDPPLAQEGSLNATIFSIATEELSLSHLLNMEGEKLQYVLGALPGLVGAASLDEVIQVNKNVKDTPSGIVEQQTLLASKLAGATKFPMLPGPAGPMVVPPTATAAFAANTRSGIVDLNQHEMWRDTDIGLPDEQLLSPDILTDRKNAEFLLTKGGRLSNFLACEPSGSADGRDPARPRRRLLHRGHSGSRSAHRPVCPHPHGKPASQQHRHPSANTPLPEPSLQRTWPCLTGPPALP